MACTSLRKSPDASARKASGHRRIRLGVDPPADVLAALWVVSAKEPDPSMTPCSFLCMV